MGKPRIKDETSRKCNKCKKRKPRSSFRTNGTRADGTVRLRSICKECGSLKKLENTSPKKCPDCKKIKPASEFSENGRHTYCRPCANERSYEYKRGPGRKRHNACVSKRTKKKYRTDPSFRQKIKAHQLVGLAVQAGLLKKPKRCENCGKKGTLHGHHHWGYAPKNWSKVRWLCPRCHFKEHRR